MRNFLPLTVLLLFFSGCSLEDEGMLCATGPVGLTFEVVDKETGVNLFASGVYESHHIDIENKDGESVEFDLNSRNLLDVLLGWETKSDIYTVYIGDSIEFDIVFSLERTEGEYCTTTKLTDLKIERIPHEINGTTGVIQIQVTREDGVYHN